MERQRSRIAQHLVQRTAFQKLHRYVGDVALLADVVDADDVRVVQPGRGFRLEQKALSDLAHDVFGQRGVKRLDGHFALAERIGCAVDRSQGTAAEFGQQAVASERSGFHAGSERPLPPFWVGACLPKANFPGEPLPGTARLNNTLSRTPCARSGAPSRSASIGPRGRHKTRSPGSAALSALHCPARVRTPPTYFRPMQFA